MPAFQYFHSKLLLRAPFMEIKDAPPAFRSTQTRVLLRMRRNAKQSNFQCES